MNHLLQIGAFVALYVLLLSMSILCKHKVVSFPTQVLLKVLERGDKALLFCFTAGQCYCALHYDQRTINYCALHTNSYWYLRVFKWVTIVYCRVETLVKRHWCMYSASLIVCKDQLELGMYTGYLSAYVLPRWTLSCLHHARTWYKRLVTLLFSNILLAFQLTAWVADSSKGILFTVV